MIQRATGIDKESIKMHLRRILDKELLRRIHYSRSSTGGGAIYSISDSVKHRIWNHSGTNQEHYSGTKNVPASDDLLRKNSGPISSSSNTTTTTEEKSGSAKTEKSPWQEFSNKVLTHLQWEEIDRYVGPNDVSGVVQSGKMTEEELFMSLSHMAYVIETDTSGTIIDPTSFIVGKLKLGCYLEPKGYKSREVRKEEAMIASAKRQREEIERMRNIRVQEEIERDFLQWVENLSLEDKAKKLNGLKEYSESGKAILRECFRKDHNLSESIIFSTKA